MVNNISKINPNAAPESIDTIQNWIINNSNVIDSPGKNDVLKIGK